MIGLALALAAQATSPAPVGSVHSAEVEPRLAALVGDWTIPGQETTYRETCDWFGPRAFVVCNATDASDGSRSQSTLGYSKARERYTYQTYSSSGNSRYEWGFPHAERGLVFTDERPAAAGTTRVQVWLEPQADGRLRFRQERSVNGGQWEQVADFFYVPRISRPSKVR